VTQSLIETFGGLSLPAQAGDVDTTLAPLDPGRDALLALCAAAINAELGAAWRKVVATVPSEQQIDRQNPVGDTFPGAPTPATMLERKAHFPLLALHRDGRGVYEPHLIDHDRLRQPWEMHYILGPLDVGDTRRLQEACIAAAKLVSRTISQGGHPAYQGGALVLFGSDPETALFGELRMVSHEGPGQAVFAGDEKQTPYMAITMQLESLEYPSLRSDDSAGALDGVDLDVGIGGAPEGIIHGLLYADSNHPG